MLTAPVDCRTPSIRVLAKPPARDNHPITRPPLLILIDAPISPSLSRHRGRSMTPNALTALLALIALPMPAMAGQRTIYTNDGNVVCRYTTDREGTKAFQDRVHSS